MSRSEKPRDAGSSPALFSASLGSSLFASGALILALFFYYGVTPLFPPDHPGRFGAGFFVMMEASVFAGLGIFTSMLLFLVAMLRGCWRVWRAAFPPLAALIVSTLLLGYVILAPGT